MGNIRLIMLKNEQKMQNQDHENNQMRNCNIRKLKDGWSPEMIAHAWNNLKYEPKVGVTCIYNFVNRRIELKHHALDADIKSGMYPQKR